MFEFQDDESIAFYASANPHRLFQASIPFFPKSQPKIKIPILREWDCHFQPKIHRNFRALQYEIDSDFEMNQSRKIKNSQKRLSCGKRCSSLDHTDVVTRHIGII